MNLFLQFSDQQSESGGCEDGELDRDVPGWEGEPGKLIIKIKIIKIVKYNG